MSIAKRLISEAERKWSRLILALDVQSRDDAVKVTEQVSDYVVAVKVGLPLILSAGPNVLREVKRYIPIVIVDFKLADIGYVMSKVARILHGYGADAVIAHGFVGVFDALSELSSTCRSLGIGLFVVASMSHLGARELLNMHMYDIVKKAEMVDADGIVLPATDPKYIVIARKVLEYKKLILSPGVGAQGAKPGDALRHGADFEIVGRAVYASKNPREAAKQIVEAQRRVLEVVR